MTPPRRARTGTRRDGQVRVIRSGDVRYPGVDLPSGVDYSARSGDGRLRPARDTGLALEGRLARERRLRSRRRRSRTVAALAAIALLGVAALGWRYSSDRKAAATPLPSAESSASVTPRHSVQADPATPQLRAMNPELATPMFARYKSLMLRLPVTVADLSELGFHQASYTYALHLNSPLKRADMTQAKKDRSTHRDKGAQESGPAATLVGETLVMWRARPGKPDSAVDIGADAGSDVLSPVTGTVVKVKRYKLYGKYPDYEIHITPDGWPNVDTVLIHVDDVSVKPGDVVVAGITRLATVRKLDPRVNPQLARYTTNGGNHVHMQLNDATDPEYKGREGAITPAAKP
ncbi:MAG: M23 family metallopeptidase [Actinobacteria bacterium]|nr:MAG: M23 family metallopeptidase [Actinomycetota bacterium]